MPHTFKTVLKVRRGNTLAGIYTQTKKLRPFFMVLYLSIQLCFCHKNKTKIFSERETHENSKSSECIINS